MADRFPLIANSSANQIQELAAGDNLSLTASNIVSSGIVTVSAPVDISKDIKVGAAATITGATTLTGAVNVDATTDSTSITTGALIIDGGVGIAKNVYIGAGLSVAGTLTYEDVTNVDSVGLITAKSGVNVSGGQLIVGAGFSVGAAGVGTFAGNLVVNGDIDLEGDIDVNGTCEADAYTVAGTALDTHIAGVTVTNATNSAHVYVTDNESTNEDNLITFVEDATSSTGNVGLEMDGNLTYNPSSGTVSATTFSGAFSGSLSGGSVSANGGTFTGDVFFDNGLDAGKDLTWDVSRDALVFNDSVYAEFGTDSDANIVHDGSNLYLTNTTGSLYIRPKSGEDGITLVPDGAVTLSYNNSAKLATTNDGVVITGICTDSLGNVRYLPPDSKSGAYVLVAGDAGKAIYISTGGVTVNQNIIPAGGMVTIINNSGSSQTITQGSSVNLYNTADGTTGNKTLTTRGTATLWSFDGTAIYITGNI